MTLPRIVGYAIVSADGMIANAAGLMPAELLIEADQSLFHRGLEQASAMIHGRHSHEQYKPTARSPRIIVTRAIAALARDDANDHALLWNPAGATFEEAWHALGLDNGTLAVIGGTDIFGMFLPRYDAFYLSRAERVCLPGGRPVFPQVPAQTPENVLEKHGLRAGPRQELDPAAGLTLVTWDSRAPRIR